MPCFVNVSGTLRGQWNQPNQNPEVLFCCAVDIFWNITNCEIQWPGMLIAQKNFHMSHFRCPYDWHNCRSGRKLILVIPQPMSRVHLAVDSTTLGVSQAHRVKIEVRLKWEMCQKELDTFENIPVL
jgi:hypothetical protein